MTTREDTRTAVIGYGYWGPNLLRNLHQTPGCKAVALCDRDRSRLDAAKRTYPHLEVTPDADSLIRRRDIDAVVIATPVSSHAPLARAALREGKDVLVSKPLTATSAEAQELLDLAGANGRILMVDHTFVFSGAVRRVRELIERGDLGTLLYFDSVRVNLGLLQSDVNVLWDLAPHDLSILDYLLGRDPLSISAVGAAPIILKDWAHESVAYITLRYPDAFMAHIHVNWLSPIKLRRTLIGGSRKMVVYDHLDPDNQVKIYDRGVELSDGDTASRARVQYRVGDMFAPKVDQTEALQLECRHFLECIRNRSRPITDGRAGARVIRLLELAQESLRQGGSSISVRFEDSLRAGESDALPSRLEAP